MKNLLPLRKESLPPSPSFWKLIGPSFILLGLGLGSGEIILWPYLVSNWGLGIIWGVLLGISFQFVMNMEIERYSLINGESIFVGFARKFGKIAPIWFILSTLIPWMWPGIIASSGKIIAAIFEFQKPQFVSMFLLLLIGLILTVGPTLYKTVERFQKTLIILGVPFILFLVFQTVQVSDLVALSQGLVGIGEGYLFLPEGISLASFLAAFAYTGAGGNLNLAQSFYVKEKGYGMGQYSGKITSILTGKKEHITLEGATFEINENNLSEFNKWWRKTNLEHAIVFLGTGFLTIILLALLAYANVYGKKGVESGINFILLEADVLGNTLIPFVRGLFLMVAGIFLFATQLTVIDATSRIMSENLIIFNPKRFNVSNLPKYFYTFLWVQIFSGCVIFLAGLTEPLALLTLGAIFNAVAMFVHIGSTLYLNKTTLHKKLKPNMIRTIFMIAAFLFFGVFSLFTISQQLGLIN